MATCWKVELWASLFLIISVTLKGFVFAHGQETNEGQNRTSLQGKFQQQPWVSPHLERSNNSHPQQLVGSSNSTPQNTVTIAVLGRNRSGIPSTVHELIGPNSTCNKSEESEPFHSIVEYILEIPSANNSSSAGKVKILDIPGFVDGRTLEQDAQILASLKSYVQTEGPPDLYLALSPFDESRVDGVRSLFRQFLKRIQLFNDIFLNNTAVASIDNNNMVLLLTGLMSETKVNQRKPARKIGEFQRAIQAITNFPSPISIAVGENNAGTDYGVPVIDGYYRLPNKQLYPKNVWEALINLSSNDDATRDLLTNILNSREVALRCEAKVFSAEWESYDDDADAFSYLLRLLNTTVADTEINREIENAFGRDNRKKQAAVQKTALQLRLQEGNITSKDDLPKNPETSAAFFQDNRQFSTTIPAHLLALAFNLQMPIFRKRLTVGYGYVIMEDEMSAVTPFRKDIYEPSSVGHQFPNFIKCTRLLPPEIQYFKSYSVNMSDYAQERLRYLHFKENKNVSESILNFKVKEGFNIPPEEGENVAVLTAVDEHRIMKCGLRKDTNQWLLNAEFIEEVDSLMAVDIHDRGSVRNWQNWFGKWGSHIVATSFGGGRLHGSIQGQNVTNLFQGPLATIDETLNSILGFTPFPVDNLEEPEYGLYGGESDEQSESLYTLEEDERNALIERWENSLNSDFIMLTNEFGLLPISKIVSEKIGKGKGKIVAEAIELLLQGELKYGSWPGAGTNGNRQRIPVKLVSATHWSHSNSTNSTASSPSHENSDVAQTVLQSQIDNNNMMIKSLEQRIADKRNRDEQQYQKDLVDLERLKGERKRYAEERAAQMEESYRQSMQNKHSYYQSHIDTLKQQIKQEEDHIRRQIEDVQRENDDAERRLQLRLQEIKRQQEEEAERERRRCKGSLKMIFQTSCW